jgi:hypothetical protein
VEEEEESGREARCCWSGGHVVGGLAVLLVAREDESGKRIVCEGGLVGASPLRRSSV